MANPYKLTPIELVLSPKQHFEGNLSKFINNMTIADNEKLILLRVDRHKPYRDEAAKKMPLIAKRKRLNQSPG